jgi:hypothetical protein
LLLWLTSATSQRLIVVQKRHFARDVTQSVPDRVGELGEALMGIGLQEFFDPAYPTIRAD